MTALLNLKVRSKIHSVEIPPSRQNTSSSELVWRISFDTQSNLSLQLLLHASKTQILVVFFLFLLLHTWNTPKLSMLYCLSVFFFVDFYVLFKQIYHQTVRPDYLLSSKVSQHHKTDSPQRSGVSLDVWHHFPWEFFFSQLLGKSYSGRKCKHFTSWCLLRSGFVCFLLNKCLFDRLVFSVRHNDAVAAFKDMWMNYTSDWGAVQLWSKMVSLKQLSVHTAAEYMHLFNCSFFSYVSSVLLWWQFANICVWSLIASTLPPACQ